METRPKFAKNAGTRLLREIGRTKKRGFAGVAKSEQSLVKIVRIV
jgi:hypothetical protein